MKRRHCGFTLIELLIAIAISSGVVLLAYQALDGAIDTEERVKATTTSINELQRVWRYMQDDFLHAVPRQWTDQLGAAQPAVNGLLLDRQSATSVLEITDDSRVLHFIRAGDHNFFNQPQSDMQHIVYRLSKEVVEGSNDFSISLWRDYWRPIDAEPARVKTLQLLGDIKNIQFRYLSGSSQTVNDSAWVGGWPESDEQNNQLPIAVEVMIATHALGDIKRVFLLSDYDE